MPYDFSHKTVQTVINTNVIIYEALGMHYNTYVECVYNKLWAMGLYKALLKCLHFD